MSGDEEPRREAFLSRWSRLKREPTEPKEGSAAAPQLDPLHPADELLPEGRTLADLIAELPDIKDLMPGQDLSAFMKAWVPQDLRNAALRRMWTMDPAIRDYVCEALDYAYDYNMPATVPGFGLHIPDQDAVQGVVRMFEDALDAIADSQRPERDRIDAEASVASDAASVKNEKIAATQHEADASHVSQFVAATPGKANLSGGVPPAEICASPPAFAPSQMREVDEKTASYDRRPRRNGGALPQG